MQIPKEFVLKLLADKFGGGDQRTQQADQELPGQVDTEQHGDLLSKLGVSPQELLSAFTGGSGGAGGQGAGGGLGGAVDGLKGKLGL
ncbi:hypothetical protein [Kineococcus terrestris]|uniref:hypothetical protein n=1 Tax=Kineococcus terrestris TaxID=2044856 RepID=UPI0034DB02C8